MKKGLDLHFDQNGKVSVVPCDIPENFYELRMMMHAEIDEEIRKDYGPQTDAEKVAEVINMFGL